MYQVLQSAVFVVFAWTGMGWTAVPSTETVRCSFGIKSALNGRKDGGIVKKELEVLVSGGNGIAGCLL